MAITMTDERRALIAELDQHFNRYRRSQRYWSFWNWTPLYATPVAAFGATILAAVGENEVATTVLAAIATLLGAVSAVGRFGEKWRINRESRSKVEVLRVEIRTNPEADLSKLRDELEKIIPEQDGAILGTTT